VLNRPVTRLLAITITVILVVAAAAVQTVYRWQRRQAAAAAVQQPRRRRRLPGSNDVAYYRHVLTLDRLAGRCAAVTGGRQPSTLGERFKKLAS